MLTIIGVLFLVLAIGKFIYENVRKNQIKENSKDGYQVTVLPEFPIGIKSVYLAVIGIVIFMLNGMFFWADAGTAYAVQYPWGGDKMVSTQGLKVKFWGRTIPLSYETSVKDIILDKHLNEDGSAWVLDDLPETHQGVYNRKARRWEFSDAIKADIAISVIVGVGIEDEEKFLQMADRNRSEQKLIYGRVLPNIDAALKNTCKLMDAQEYISGKASDFDRYFRDQLEHGMYQVEEYIFQEDMPEIIGDSATVRTIKPVNGNTKSKRYRIKRDSQGNIIRDNDSNTLTQYGIHIYQAQVTSIDWEESFDKRLDLQKDEVAKTQLEKQEAERQYYTAKKEIAKGESEKAAERARLEKEQIKLTIAAETKAKVASENLIAEKKQYEVEIYKAKSKKVAADAQYYENAKLVSAGLTPQERADLELEKARVISDNFSKMAVPNTIIMGGGSKGSVGLTESLIQANMANQLMGKKN